MTMNGYRRQAKDLANRHIGLDMKNLLTAASRKNEGIADCKGLISNLRHDYELPYQIEQQALGRTRS